jgi:hypothetical protein
MKRIVSERGDLVEMELAPDVFAAVAWWHDPRSWYGPVTRSGGGPLPARETRTPDPALPGSSRSRTRRARNNQYQRRPNGSREALLRSRPSASCFTRGVASVTVGQ